MYLAIGAGSIPVLFLINDDDQWYGPFDILRTSH